MSDVPQPAGPCSVGRSGTNQPDVTPCNCPGAVVQILIPSGEVVEENVSVLFWIGRPVTYR